MLLFQLLQMLDPEIIATDCKIHLAGKNIVGEQPLDVYFGQSPNDSFDAWQARQSKKNFERAFVVSLIQTPIANRWLFAGVHKRLDKPDNPVERTGAPWVDETTRWYQYELERRDLIEPLNGRVIVAFDRVDREAGKKSGRMSYRNGDRCDHALVVDQYRAAKFAASDFSQFGQTSLAA